MQTVTPGASHLEVTPIAYGAWQFSGGWESVDEQAVVASLVREGLTWHVGVSNYSTDQITAFAAVLPAKPSSRPITCSAATSRPTCCRTRERTTSACWPASRWPMGCS